MQYTGLFSSIGISVNYRVAMFLRSRGKRQYILWVVSGQLARRNVNRFQSHLSFYVRFCQVVLWYF